jgi:hypothetical protein
MAIRKQIAQLEQQREDAQKLSRAEADKLASFGRRIKHLERALFYARSNLRATCIKDRNTRSSAAIRRDFENTLHEMGRNPTESLQVFCVAAVLHIKYLKSPKRLTGFPTTEDTQIPALRDWLISTTLKDRNNYAQAFLEDIDNLVTSMQPWINDTHADIKMTPQMRGDWEPQLEAAIKGLQEVCYDLFHYPIKLESFKSDDKL